MASFKASWHAGCCARRPKSNPPTFLSGFTADGYCSEGIGYWSYGFGHYVLIAETVAAATGNRLRLLQGAKLERVNAFPEGMELLARVYPAFSDNATTVQPANWVAPLARRGLDGGTAPARAKLSEAAGAAGSSTSPMFQRAVGSLPLIVMAKS